MIKSPLVLYVAIRQHPDAGPLLPPPKPGRHRRGRSLFRVRLPKRAPAAGPPAVPAVLTKSAVAQGGQVG